MRTIFARFLLTLRQFSLQGGTSRGRWYRELLWQRLTGDEIRGHLQRARKGYRDALKTGSLGLVINDERARPEHVLDLWINGRYFHNDKRKAAAIDALDPMSTILVRHVFLDVLIEATKYVTFLADVVIIARRDAVL